MKKIILILSIQFIFTSAYSDLEIKNNNSDLSKMKKSVFTKEFFDEDIEKFISRSIDEVIKDYGSTTGKTCGAEYVEARTYHALDINDDSDEDLLIFMTIEGLGCGASDYSFYLLTLLANNNKYDYKKITKIGAKGWRSLDYDFLGADLESIYIQSISYASDGSDPLCCPSEKEIIQIDKNDILYNHDINILRTPKKKIEFKDKSYQVIDSLNLNPQLYISKGRYTDYTHFKFYLTPYNTILPSNAKSPNQNQTNNYRDDILDENSINFTKYGQFEIFIPKEKYGINLIKDCNNFVIIRMPQTLGSNYEKEAADSFIDEKQNLYFEIKNMIESKKGYVEIIIETNGGGPCTDFFRHGGGKYQNYIGKYRKN